MYVKIDRLNFYIGSFITMLLLYSNLVIANIRYLNYVLLILAISTVYCELLISKKKVLFPQLIMSKAYHWILLFALLKFIYGYFGKDQEAYSLQFHILNIYVLTLLLCISYYFKKELIELISLSFSGVIILMSLFILINAKGDFLLSIAEGKRVGLTAVGNVNTTAISYIFLLIPIAYKVIYEKEKKYILILITGIFFMMMTGSKKGVLSIFLFALIYLTVISNNNNKLLRNILLACIGMTIFIFITYYQPYLKEIIWIRMKNMVHDIITANNASSSFSSTSLRIYFIKTSIEKGWDHPFFGHGWNSFAALYGYVPHYGMNLYTHCNYTELFFSFGIIGLYIYYYFPIKVMKFYRKILKLEIKLLMLLFTIILFFIDLGTVTCDQSILGFYGISLSYIFCLNDVQRQKRNG